MLKFYEKHSFLTWKVLLSVVPVADGKRPEGLFPTDLFLTVRMVTSGEFRSAGSDIVDLQVKSYSVQRNIRYQCF